MGSDFRGKKPLARKARENLLGFDETAPLRKSRELEGTERGFPLIALIKGPTHGGGPMVPFYGAPPTATHPSTMVVRAERLSLAAVIGVPVVLTLSGSGATYAVDHARVSGLALHITASWLTAHKTPY